MHKVYSTLLVLVISSCFGFLFSQVNEFTFKKIVEEGKDRGNVILSLGSDKINTDLKIRLQEEGATIQARYPDGTTILSIPKNKIDLFKRTLKKSVQSFDTRQKISKGINLSQDVDIAINFNREISKEELENLINDFGLSQTKLSPNKTLLESKVDGFLIEGLASLPFITFINEQIDEPLPLGENSTSFHNVAHVKSNSFDGLSGEGVVVGVGDGGKLGDHIDFNGRIINEAFSWNSNYGSHGDNVTGIIGGNGNIHEKYEGLANKANIVIQQTHYVFYYLDEYYKKYGMNITNNSYGTSFSCGTGGKYEYYSWYMDEQTNKYEDVLHVVAAGNSGGSNCSPYPAGYNTVLRSYAAGKNTLTVGAVNMNRTKAASSSAGPTLDGRIKPEITSLGQKLITTGRNYNYGGFSATSGATAVTTGIVTLLYEKYKNTHNGQNPNGGLIKAILCNTADDAGNPGPDFQFGFGISNIKKAVEAIEQRTFLNSTIELGTAKKTHTISVPEGKSKMKVMLYWADKAQPVYSGPALVNDLDIMVTTPSGVDYYPLIPDSTPSNVANNATQGLDRLNNIEQISIPTPEAGEYTIAITPHNLDTESQKYSVIHTMYENEISLTFPTKNNVFSPTEKIRVSWENHLTNESNGFSLEYSIDNGGTWTSINSFISPLENGYDWFMPSDSGTGDIILRVNGIGSEKSDISEKFNILARPSNIAISNPCRTNVNLSWTNTTNASEYEIFMLKGEVMESIGRTFDNSYPVHERMEIGSRYWFAIKAIYPNGKKSRRTIAKSIILSNQASCPWSNDIELTSINLGEEKGRQYTSQALSQASAVSITLSNAGTNEIISVPLEMEHNGTVYNETAAISLMPGESLTYSLSQKLDFSGAGKHNISVTANLAGDPQTFLNTISGEVEELANEPISLPNYFTLSDFNTETNHLYTSTFGIKGWESFDFRKTVGDGILSKKNIENGYDYLSIINLNGAETTHLIQTANLSNYTNNDVFVKLIYRLQNPAGSVQEQGIGPVETGVKIQARGNDTDEWINIRNLNYTEGFSNEIFINIRALLDIAGQSIGKSTQLRIEVDGENHLDLFQFDLTESDVLPVEMSYFNATKINENTLLKWGTASEINNDFFEVQVAKGDKNFRNELFEALGKINGNGNSVELIDYQFADNDKFKSGTYYYRLKQVDFDGTYEYSQVIPVFFGGEPIKDIIIFPNVITEEKQPNLYVKADEEYKVDLILTRADGKIYDTFQGIYPAGSSTIQIPMNQNVPSGLFYVTGKIGEQIVNEKIIKVE